MFDVNKDELKTSLKPLYKYTSSFVSGLALAVVDAIAFMLSIGIGFFIVNAINTSWITFISFRKYAVFLPFLFAIFYINGLYPGILLAPEDEMKRFSTSTFLILIGAAFYIITIKAMRDFWPIAVALAISWIFTMFFLPLGRELSRRFFARFSWWGVPAVIYSKGSGGNDVVERLQQKTYLGYRPILIVTDSIIHEKEFGGLRIVEQSEEVFDVIKSLRLKVAIVCAGYNKNLDELQNYYRYFIFVPKTQSYSNMSLHMKDLGGMVAVSWTNYLRKTSALTLKRLIDLFVCVCACPFAIVLSIIIAIAIKIDSKGPIFYGHKRIGKNHKPIKCWKFRSMCIDADQKLQEILESDPIRAQEWQESQKFSDDPRVTKVGKFLRKTSLDEVPQLWNIFLGQMSFVGPRPVTEAELDKYGKKTDEILSVTPGLSGMWQVSGRSDTNYEERINLDTYYIQNWSVWLDLWILTKTVGVVLRGKGAC